MSMFAPPRISPLRDQANACTLAVAISLLTGLLDTLPHEDAQRARRVLIDLHELHHVTRRDAHSHQPKSSMLEGLRHSHAEATMMVAVVDAARQHQISNDVEEAACKLRDLASGRLDELETSIIEAGGQL
ncbi:hypothetical protein [uncultured Tessaracoccus sp.]|uniref:hypothetical protein n=1 Tax=uncultured Tessaracoccus sp. TaxID=905023 RepID=UPI0025ED9E96|nr:hypothetical protein [uncultured Tessaracoccus sp.]